MKTRPVGAELLHADGHTDWRTDITKQVVAVRNLALTDYVKGSTCQNRRFFKRRSFCCSNCNCRCCYYWYGRHLISYEIWSFLNFAKLPLRSPPCYLRTEIILKISDPPCVSANLCHEVSKANCHMTSITEKVTSVFKETIKWNVNSHNQTLKACCTACCFVWVWNLVADIEGGKEAEGVWEYGVEENIWT